MLNLMVNRIYQNSKILLLLGIKSEIHQYCRKRHLKDNGDSGLEKVSIPWKINIEIFNNFQLELFGKKILSALEQIFFSFSVSLFLVILWPGIDSIKRDCKRIFSIPNSLPSTNHITKWVTQSITSDIRMSHHHPMSHYFKNLRFCWEIDFLYFLADNETRSEELLKKYVIKILVKIHRKTADEWFHKILFGFCKVFSVKINAYQAYH